MPELPEVETVARGLRQTILGRRILSVTLGKTDFIDDPSALEQHLPGRQIEAVERYGKFMLLRLSATTGAARAATNGDVVPASLLVHLGISTRMKAFGARKFIRRGSEPSSAGKRRRLCAARCKIFCKKQLRCAAPQFPIFLTPMASRENISGTIGPTDARGKTAIAAKRRFGARLWRREERTLFLIVHPSPDGCPGALAPGKRKKKKKKKT